MGYKVIASPLANTSYLQNIEFLEKRWSKKEVVHFITKVADVVAILKISPQTFRKYKRDTAIHKIEIVKQITLYYQVNSKDVELLLFFNNLQDPTLLKNII